MESKDEQSFPYLSGAWWLQFLGLVMLIGIPVYYFCFKGQLNHFMGRSLLIGMWLITLYASWTGLFRETSTVRVSRMGIQIRNCLGLNQLFPWTEFRILYIDNDDMNGSYRIITISKCQMRIFDRRKHALFPRYRDFHKDTEFLIFHYSAKREQIILSYLPSHIEIRRNEH